MIKSSKKAHMFSLIFFIAVGIVFCGLLVGMLIKTKRDKTKQQ